MSHLKHLASFLAIVSLMSPVYAFAASVTVQNLVPGDTVRANSNVSLKIVPTGFSFANYQMADSFVNTTATVNNIGPGGQFSWTPDVRDVGSHTFTFTVTDSDGNSANTTQSITVQPPRSIAIQNISPGNQVMPGSPLTFTVVPDGFTNPTYIIGDSFSGASVWNGNINSSGSFSWTPTQSDVGEHTITIYATDSEGHGANTNITVRVGTGPTITIQSVSPSANVTPGQTVSFSVTATNFSPTAFSVIDSFPGSTASNSNVGLSGLFAWTPSKSDVGAHIIRIIGQVGAFGASASTTQTINVIGPDGVIPVAAPTVQPSTTGGSSLLAGLQAQLAALQSKIVSQTGSGSAATVTTSSDFKFTSYLKPGSEGDEVLKLQNLLKQQGFLSVDPNGYYGPATTDAVAAFQGAHGLPKLGVVGPATRVELNALLSSAPSTTTTSSTTTTAESGSKFVFEHFMGIGDDDEPDVMELQKRLISLGYMSGEPTGYFGSKTEAAVKKFQAANGLPQTGYAAKDTRAALNK